MKDRQASLEVALQETLDTVKAILRRMEAKEAPKKPGLTLVAFAKAAGIGRTTAYRLMEKGKLYRKNGRIPSELLKNFQS